jgi:hypothetical protein
LGYTQVPGIDFQDNFAPVVDEVTFRILLIIGMVNKWEGEIIGVEMAFLYGELEEEIYLKVPEGLEEYENKNLKSKSCLLKKAMYGLVQAARVWWKEFTKTLVKELNYEACMKDCCLFKRVTGEGTVIICLYVDDSCITGDAKAIETAIKELEVIYAIKRVGPIDEYVGCTVERKDGVILLSQPHLINKMIQNFKGKLLSKSGRMPTTPAGTGEAVQRPREDQVLLKPGEQTEYRSGTGMLLFLIKHSRPDINNAVRELTKVMDTATDINRYQMYRLMKYVIKTRNRKLLLNPNMDENGNWSMRAFCDSDFAGDKDTRRSITGFIIYLYGSPIAWRSRSQKSVSLSSTEAEYVALSEVATEIIFIKDILEFMGIEVKVPIVVNVDNVGAIYLAKKAGSTSRTKHVDTRYHYVREYIEDGVLLVQFVRLEDNDADTFTKNVGGILYEKHTNKYMIEN